METLAAFLVSFAMVHIAAAAGRLLDEFEKRARQPPVVCTKRFDERGKAVRPDGEKVDFQRAHFVPECRGLVTKVLGDEVIGGFPVELAEAGDGELSLRPEVGQLSLRPFGGAAGDDELQRGQAIVALSLLKPGLQTVEELGILHQQFVRTIQYEADGVATRSLGIHLGQKVTCETFKGFCLTVDQVGTFLIQ
ncbi:MAG: hypothetical protein R3F13_12835 [Prosthecobacter sp.]